MNYVFCPSYRPLFFALYLKDLGKDVTVITYNEDVRKVCIDGNIRLVYFELVRPDIITFYKVVTLKRRLDNIIKQIDFSEEDIFYLLDKATAYEGFYLAKKLSKKGTAYFRDASRELKIYKGKFNRVYWERLAIRYLLRVFLGLDLIFYDINTFPRIGINDRFLGNNRIVKVAQDEDFDSLILDVARKSDIYQQHYDNLMVIDGPGIISIVENDSLRKAYKNLSDLPLEFVLKKHPSPTKGERQIDKICEEFFRNCDEIPDYIPVELAFNAIRKNVISVFSATLIVASQMKNLRAISLLELVEWHNQSYKSEVKNYLKESSKNRIIFVNDFEELRRLILNEEKA